jgi:hypothetical protein
MGLKMMGSCVILLSSNTILPERFSIGRGLLEFPKIILEIRVRFLLGDFSPQKIVWEVLLC